MSGSFPPFMFLAILYPFPIKLPLVFGDPPKRFPIGLAMGGLGALAGLGKTDGLGLGTLAPGLPFDRLAAAAARCPAGVYAYFFPFTSGMIVSFLFMVLF